MSNTSKSNVHVTLVVGGQPIQPARSFSQPSGHRQWARTTTRNHRSFERCGTIDQRHSLFRKDAVELFPTAGPPAPSQTSPHPFKIKTENGIKIRSSYLASDFVDVLALLAEELSEFLDYWEYVPCFGRSLIIQQQYHIPSNKMHYSDT